MVAMLRRLKSFQIVFDDSKSFYCGGDRLSGRVQVEVNEVTRVSALRFLALGCAKVEYAKGKQRCRQEAEYLRHEAILRLRDQPTGTSEPSTSPPSLVASFERRIVSCPLAFLSLKKTTKKRLRRNRQHCDTHF